MNPPHNRLLNALMGAKEPRIAFWMSPQNWPDDAGDHIFAARALLRLGRIQHGDNWSDSSPMTELAWELPETLTLYTPHSDVMRAVSVLDQPNNGMGGLASFGVRDEFPTQIEWAKARAIIKQLADESWDRFMPYVYTARRIALACRANVMRSAIRAPEGGAFNECEWHLWNLEGGWTRFDTCRLMPDAPYSKTLPTADGHWLFLHAADFDKFCEKKDHAGSPEQNEDAVKKEIEQVRQRRSSGGRPDKYPWDEMAGELFRIIHVEGIPDYETEQQLPRRLMEWAEVEWSSAPSINAIKPRFAKWLAGLKKECNA